MLVRDKHQIEGERGLEEGGKEEGMRGGRPDQLDSFTLTSHSESRGDRGEEGGIGGGDMVFHSLGRLALSRQSSVADGYGKLLTLSSMLSQISQI